MNRKVIGTLLFIFALGVAMASGQAPSNASGFTPAMCQHLPPTGSAELVQYCRELSGKSPHNPPAPNANPGTPGYGQGGFGSGSAITPAPKATLTPGKALLSPTGNIHTPTPYGTAANGATTLSLGKPVTFTTESRTVAVPHCASGYEPYRFNNGTGWVLNDSVIDGSKEIYGCFKTTAKGPAK